MSLKEKACYCYLRLSSNVKLTLTKRKHIFFHINNHERIYRDFLKNTKLFMNHDAVSYDK